MSGKGIKLKPSIKRYETSINSGGTLDKSALVGKITIRKKSIKPISHSLMTT